MIFKAMSFRCVVLMGVHLHSNDLECAKICAESTSCKALQFQGGKCLTYSDLTQLPCEETYVMTSYI